MSKVLPKVLLAILAFLVLGNLVWLDYRTLKKEEVLLLPEAAEEEVSGFTEVEEGEEPEATVCGLDCQTKIAEEVAKAIATVSGERVVTQKTVETVAQPTATPQTIYLPLGNGGSTSNLDWAEISGSDFIFDLADYRSGAEVYWQGNLKANSGNSRCYARVYDVTHNRGVDFSEQSTDQISYQTLTSQRLSIWQGENKYRLQIRSLNGITCFLESPRLIIVDK